MTGVLLVALALAGVCAYVWSAIVQEDTPDGTRAAGGPFALRALTLLRRAPGRWFEARRKRRDARIERDLERGPRRLRFEDTADLTLPSVLPGTAAEAVEDWSERPSRLLSAVQLALLILLVGGAVAVSVLGVARVVARIVSTE